MNLNEYASDEWTVLANNAGRWRCLTEEIGEASVIDVGAKTPGGIEAGLQLARVCLAGLGQVTLAPGPDGPQIQVYSDQPQLACLASQYAGWQVKVDKYFAMGSGAMRQAYGKEAIFEHLPRAGVAATRAVGVLETKSKPTPEVIDYIAERTKVPRATIRLAFAPAASIAGTIQVVARSLETALHKIHELEMQEAPRAAKPLSISEIVSGYGVAPMPPVARDEMKAIGWTNDAILYGAHVVLWVRAEDAAIEAIGAQVPASASRDYGVSFAELFARYNGDFYKIDPMLFSPAVVEFRNLQTGHTFVYGKLNREVLTASFAKG